MDFTLVTDAAGQWLMNMETDLTRYAVFAVGVWLALWVLFAPILRGRKVRAESPPTKQLALEFLISLRSVAIFSTIGLFTFLLERFGLLPGPQIAASWGVPWFWASLALMIVAHDAYFYWAHRLVHHPRLFRVFHRRHHKSMNPSPFTAYSFDLGEAAVMASFVPLWMICVPTQWEATGLFMLHQIVRNTLGHSGYELMPARADGRPMFDWLTTTTHHDMHHAQAGWNYGLYFTWWDRLMGTEHPEYHAKFAAVVRKPLAPKPANGAPAAIAAALFVFMLVFAGSEHANAQPRSEIAGNWATRGFGSIVQFRPCAHAPDAMCGRIVWLWEPNDSQGRARTDNRNPDHALRSRSLIGVEIVSGLRESAPQVWSEGSVYNPDDGRTYTGSIRLRNGVLELRGCALGVFCETQTWRRPEDVTAAIGRLAQ
jgi:sterol desaturase/sphingolipid hydroxylase (fatty acid hydroxylase superfamily)